MLNLKKVHRYTKRFLKKSYKRNKFEYVQREDRYEVNGSLFIPKVGREVQTSIMVLPNGTAYFIAGFGPIPFNAETLLIINRFNKENSVFAGYLDDDNYFFLSYFFKCELNAAYKSYARTVFSRLGSMTDEGTFLRLMEIMNAADEAEAEEE